MTRAFVVHPVVDARGARSPDSRLREAVGLAEALALEIVGAEVAPISALRPATLFGSAKVAELGALFQEESKSRSQSSTIL